MRWFLFLRASIHWKYDVANGPARGLRFRKINIAYIEKRILTLKIALRNLQKVTSKRVKIPLGIQK